MKNIKLTTAYIIAILFSSVAMVSAVTNIDTTYYWAWNDVAGWIDFYRSGNGVEVGATRISQSAIIDGDADGYIVLDCATSPGIPSNICSTSNFYVTKDEDTGALAGWGWNDDYGWISFCGNTSQSSTLSGSDWVCPGTPTYQVTIDPTTGEFSGWAWNDFLGWISFNCDNDSSCATVEYYVLQDVDAVVPGATPACGDYYLDSAVFDTGYSGGVTINSIMWRGDQETGSDVRFQMSSLATASSTPTFIGSDGTESTYYEPGDQGVPVPVQGIYHNNKRYFAYRICITDSGGANSVVEDVIINWSP